MRATRLAAAVSVFGIASLGSACADALGPEREVIVPFAIDDAQRTTLTSVLRSATRDELLGALVDRDARARLVAAFERLTERVANNDRGGAQRAIRAAREGLHAYGALTPSDLGALLELAALSLALDHAEMLAGMRLRRSTTSDDRTRPTEVRGRARHTGRAHSTGLQFTHEVYDHAKVSDRT